MTTTVALGAPHAPDPMQGMSANDFQSLIAALRQGQIPQAPAEPGTAGHYRREALECKPSKASQAHSLHLSDGVSSSVECHR